MQTTEEKIAELKLEDQEAEAIKNLRAQLACHVCLNQGTRTAEGKCPHCGWAESGIGIEPEKQKEYERGLKKIRDRFARY